MNILFILPEYYPHSGGGISTYYDQYIRALQPYCNKIKVIVGSGYTHADNAFEHNGISVEYLKPALYQKYLNKFKLYDLLPDFKRDIAAAWAMWEQARQGDGFDLIECTDFSLGFIPWVVDHAKPVITRLHGSAGQISLHEPGIPADLSASFFQQTEFLLLPKCDQLISHSEANRQFWNNSFNLNKVVKVNAVYTDVYEPLPLSQRESFGLVTARLQRWKGPVELCKAYRLLKDTPPIKWIGRDTVYEKGITTGSYLKQNFSDIWGNHIIYHPPVPRAQLLQLQQKAKFGLVPSTWDMFNFTCVEFMAAGIPAICSDGAGAADLVQHNKNGFKYAGDDIQALANCLETINNLTGQDYNRIAGAALETIKTELSPGNVMPVNLELYQTTISTFKPIPSNAYFDALYKPSDQNHPISSILNKQSLKKLTKYYADRIRSKLLGKT
ncbi:glycosyltransferase family 4 protein [Mucilaginibacter sp.]|uniref:glycosyltransferase family 4 protein n=1 Tax=Mucilaginibacter sp. TaxID=1882438 RepID=UPI0035671866